MKVIRSKKTGDKIYLVKDDKKYWIKNPETLRALGFDFGAERLVGQDEFSLLESGEPIDMSNYRLFAEEEFVPDSDKKVEEPEEQPESVASPEEAMRTTTVTSSSEEEENLTSIIIPVCNVDLALCHYTANTIGSIREHTKLPYELVIIDNNSTIELGGWKWEEVADIYLKNEKNMGVPIAWNIGVKASRGKYLAILNSDIMVFDHWLEDMQESLNHVQAVTACPMYDAPWGRAVEAAERRQKWVGKEPSKYLYDSQDFSCMLTTRKIVDEIGVFDDKYGLGYGEDVDWKFRLREKGYEIKADKRVNIFHIGGATRHFLETEYDFGEIIERNKKYTKEKHGLDEFNVPKFVREGKNAK